jgi:hypothetical protein
VPDVVAAIVGAGGRVHAVEVGRTSLEDRFLRLVGGATLETVPPAGEAPPGTAVGDDHEPAGR